MLNNLGKLIVSLLISNWIYSEAMLFFPQLEPYAREVMTVLRLPTHDEWPGIMSSPSAVALNSELKGMMRHPSVRSTFDTLGLSDERLQKRLGRSLRFEEQSGSADPSPYRSGSDMYDDAAAGSKVLGGYEVFSFRS